MYSFLTLSCALFFLTCSKSIDPIDVPRVELHAENIGATEVWLRVKLVNASEPYHFSLHRNGQRIAGGSMSKSDTLVIDTTAAPRQTYRYQAFETRSNVAGAETYVMTLDTTSHSIQWQVDTLGAQGEIFDVWAFSKDNIWAVGEIFKKDATGKIDPVLYDLAVWNGQNWTLQRAVLATTNCIFAFSPNDVWIGTSAPSHWDGQQWRDFNVTGIFGGYVKKMWGTSSSNLLIVGTNGSIAHYDGTQWQKMESGTNVHLQDVWGIGANHIWATGTTGDLRRSVVLQYNGKQWSHLFDSFGQTRELDFRFESIWTDNSALTFLAGLSGQRSLITNERIFRRIGTAGNFASFRIRGTAQNDLFVASQGSELQHFNGSSWFLYPEIRILNSGFAWWYAVHPAKDLIAVGGSFFTGLNGVPVVLRGRR